MKKSKILKASLLTVALGLSLFTSGCELSSLSNNNAKEYIINNESTEEVDFYTLTNKITTETMLAHVRIEGSFYQKSRMSYQLAASSIGSGVIIEEVNAPGHTTYYCLTNNHVIYNDYSYATYVVEDCYENEFKAEVLYSSNEYDLALLKFELDDSYDELNVIELSDDDISSGEYVASLGEANGKSNSLTYGITQGYEKFEPIKGAEEESNVTFDVIKHSAFIESGSSGGSLLNTNLELVGINFASQSDSDGNWKISYAIPVSKIKEFISICENNSSFIFNN